MSNITDIAQKDPTTYTDDEIKTLTAWLREQRIRFAQEDKAAKAEGRKVRPAAINLSIDDLDIKI